MLKTAARVRNPGRARVSTTKSTPAPVRGWNARDSIANMKPGFAVRLENWWPTASDVMVRKGSAGHVTGITGEVETLATYKPESGTEVLFGWANSAIYNVSTAGAVGAAVVSTLAGIRWQTTNMVTSGGSFLLCVNGADLMQIYNGTTWIEIDGSSTPAITGVDTDDLIHVNVFKERAFYIERDTLSVWYAAAGAFAGALTELPLQAVFKKGGSLVAMGNWTLDGGSGIDDYAVFISTEGECAVYQGTNPGAAATWALVGLFEVGKPIGRRCMQKLGGDLLIITTDGVVPASKAFVRARSDESIAITDVIQGAMADAVVNYSAEFGWELTLFPEASMLLLNVPVSGGQHQYVMNTYTRAWGDFKGWNANCFAEFEGALYFGGDTVVDKAWSGFPDKTLAVRADLISAFDYFGDRSNIKYVTMMQPILSWGVGPDSIKIGVNTDFVTKDPTSEITIAATTAGKWDIGTWDVGKWGGAPEVRKDWYSASGTGYAVALHAIVENSKSDMVSYAACNFVFERGSTL